MKDAIHRATRTFAQSFVGTVALTLPAAVQSGNAYANLLFSAALAACIALVTLGWNMIEEGSGKAILPK